MDQTFNLWTKLAFVREELIAQNPFDDARSQLNEITLSNSLINSYPFTGCQTLADLTDR